MWWWAFRSYVMVFTLFALAAAAASPTCWHMHEWRPSRISQREPFQRSGPCPDTRIAPYLSWSSLSLFLFLLLTLLPMARYIALSNKIISVHSLWINRRAAPVVASGSEVLEDYRTQRLQQGAFSAPANARTHSDELGAIRVEVDGLEGCVRGQACPAQHALGHNQRLAPAAASSAHPLTLAPQLRGHPTLLPAPVPVAVAETCATLQHTLWAPQQPGFKCLTKQRPPAVLAQEAGVQCCSDMPRP